MGPTEAWKSLYHDTLFRTSQTKTYHSVPNLSLLTVSLTDVANSLFLKEEGHIWHNFPDIPFLQQPPVIQDQWNTGWWGIRDTEGVIARGIAVGHFTLTYGRKKTVLLVKCPSCSDALWTLSPQAGFHNLAVSLCVLSWSVVQFFPPAAFSVSSGTLDTSQVDLCRYTFSQTACKLTAQLGTWMEHVTLRRVFSLWQTTIAVAVYVVTNKVNVGTPQPLL